MAEYDCAIGTLAGVEDVEIAGGADDAAAGCGFDLVAEGADGAAAGADEATTAGADDEATGGTGVAPM